LVPGKETDRGSRIATRHEKTDTAYMAMLFLAGAMIWMR